MKILAVDKDPGTMELLKLAFSEENPEIRSISNGAEAIKFGLEINPDLIVLEVDLEGIDGLELCSQFRDNPIFRETIIVFYSSKTEEYIQLAALDTGADDFFLKPVKARMFRSKIKAILRRKNGIGPADQEHLKLDMNRFSVIKNGTHIYLPKKEFELLYLLFSKQNTIFSRKEIIERVWRNSEVKSRALDVHIRHLREKIGEDFIKTVKGLGYGFISPGKAVR